MRLSLTFLVIMMLGAKATFALSCVPPVPFDKNVFFKGTILKIEDPNSSATDGKLAAMNCTYHYQIRVDEPWYGVKQGDVIQVAQQQWMCGNNHHKNPDKQHNIALNKSEAGDYLVGMCDSLFFNPHDESGALHPDFLKRLEDLKVANPQ